MNSSILAHAVVALSIGTVIKSTELMKSGMLGSHRFGAMSAKDTKDYLQISL